MVVNSRIQELAGFHFWPRDRLQSLLSFPPEECFYGVSKYAQTAESKNFTLLFIHIYSFLIPQHVRSHFFLQVHRMGQKIDGMHLNMAAEPTSETWWVFGQNPTTMLIFYVYRIIQQERFSVYSHTLEDGSRRYCRNLSKLQNLN